MFIHEDFYVPVMEVLTKQKESIFNKGSQRGTKIAKAMNLIDAHVY